MTQYKHLKERSHYSDLYDRHTVDECRSIERLWDKKGIEKSTDTKITEEQAQKIRVIGKELQLYFVVGERYLNREKTIEEWIDTDEKKDQLYESAQAPEDIRCLTCRNRLKPTFKEFWSEIDKEDRILFIYDCPNRCLPRRAFFHDGEEWRIKPKLCLHCDIALTLTEENTEEKIISTYVCSKCGYKEVDEYVWSKKEEEIDEDFPKDRDRFCLTEETGKRYQEEKWNLERMGKLMEEWKEEEKEREEKLKANPKGFHLEGVGYTCFICGGSTSEGDNWYDEYGIKCLICQKAIDEGEISATLAKDKDSWYTKYDIETSFNVKSPTLRSWIKKGIIKSRTVSHYGKGVHYEFFLIEDNKDFLPPKHLVESHSVKERRDGKDFYTTQPWYHFVDPQEHLKGYKILDYLKFTEGEKRE